jgi:hypothetical protein
MQAAFLMEITGESWNRVPETGHDRQAHVSGRGAPALRFVPTFFCSSPPKKRNEVCGRHGGERPDK